MEYGTVSAVALLTGLRYALAVAPAANKDENNARVCMAGACVWGSNSRQMNCRWLPGDADLRPTAITQACAEDLAELLGAVVKIDENACAEVDGLIVRVRYTNEPIEFTLSKHSIEAPPLGPDLPVRSDAPPLDSKAPRIAGEHIKASAWSDKLVHYTYRGGVDGPVRIDVWHGEFLHATSIVIPERSHDDRQTNLFPEDKPAAPAVPTQVTAIVRAEASAVIAAKHLPKTSVIKASGKLASSAPAKALPAPQWPRKAAKKRKPGKKSRRAS